MTDTSRQIDAVRRTVHTDDSGADALRVQRLEQRYPSPIDDVWDAVTSADRIPRWFMPVEGDLRLGGRYQLIGNAGGEVLECDPPEDGRAGYRATWEFGGGVSWIAVRLRADGHEATTLTLEHVARIADVPSEFWDQFGPGATGVGWDSGLLGLSLHLQGDASIPPEQAEAWMVSPEGQSFARAAADAWAAADVAAGADPAVAARAADATFGFYTGQ